MLSRKESIRTVCAGAQPREVLAYFDRFDWAELTSPAPKRLTSLTLAVNLAPLTKSVIRHNGFVNFSLVILEAYSNA